MAGKNKQDSHQPPSFSRIKDSFLSGKTVVLSFRTELSEIKSKLDYILEEILCACGLKGSRRQIMFCLYEMISNGRKANLKRLLFLEKGLDINEPEEYKIGMKDFSRDIVLKSKYLKMNKVLIAYWIKIWIEREDSALKITIENNAKLNNYERLRIMEKQSIVKGYSSFSDILLTTNDQEEGAGLGLLVLLFLLKKSVPGAAFSFQSETGLTRTLLHIPLQNARHSQ